MHKFSDTLNSAILYSDEISAYKIYQFCKFIELI